MTGPMLTRLSSIAALLLILSGCGEKVEDEAAVAGLDESHFRHAGEDYFKDMDGAIALSPEEVKGRNMWLVWSGGNDRFWDYMTRPTYGGFDLLKIIAPMPAGGVARRDARWKDLGLINEPCFGEPTGPDPKRFGLWLDVRDPACPADPFADETKYPGVKLGARGEKLPDGSVFPVGSYYGWPTGIVGLRLFTNPEFNADAAKKWDAKRFYTDPTYYNDPKLVRPYRVGMSCGFCHVGPSPVNPPADPARPQWANLSSTVGAQYMWVDRLFFWQPNERNFMYQWVKTFRPGAMDTSLVSTDNINNPRTMNAIYSLGARLEIAKHTGKEVLSGGGLKNKQFNDYFSDGPMTAFFKAPDTSFTPRVLKDGSDSVGALGALNRVYLNIGLFSEEWLRHFNAVAGGKPISPMEISVAQAHSPYWRATEAGTPATALFFLKAGRPDRLADAPGGAALVAAPPAVLERGRQVFADTCARCHSSKTPIPPPEVSIAECNGPNYLGCFGRWWRWTQTTNFKEQMRAIVAQPDFLTNNYLSSEKRIPLTLLRTNACSPLATNALRGNIWDNFSSESYKTLPSVGHISLRDPFTAKPVYYQMPGGGRGYTRPPSLISAWSTAPFLLNNSVGLFNQDPSVAGRLAAFDDAIQQMLLLKPREFDPELGAAVGGVIDRTTRRSYLFIPKGFVPDLPGKLEGAEERALKSLINENGDIVIGPIPKGMPVNLLANLKPLAESKDPAAVAKHYGQLITLLAKLKASLIRVPTGESDLRLRGYFANLREPLMALNKCPDFVVNRGHYFGTAEFNNVATLTQEERAWGPEPVLSDDDKRALIAFLKTL
ncbi:hypothetical protein ACFB49_07400 [Sphingomonas sp. DBB INV C78]|uniref:hypothetical protein n=1 Tax=Sphingomonas sp. DBB INV C78 TaxID=3349434 RepID=UPI0036D368B7